MRVLAVDLGATSIRVASVDLDAPRIAPTIVHRWPHSPLRHDDGSLRWDWDGIVREVRHGLDLALAQGPAASIGIDGWAVDYGLAGADGQLLSAPHSYRDDRTSGWEAVADRLGRKRLYEATGIQLMAINTIFQLAAHDPRELAATERLLLLPDLLVHELTGFTGAERSNASTTALLDSTTGDWREDLLSAVGVPRGILAPVSAAGTCVGAHQDVPVHLVGSHDTASAFVAAPGVPSPSTAFVSSGTWVLVGLERPVADTSDAAREANFSNEHGAMGGVRFLKNVMGFWLLEQCRSAWGGPPIEELVAAAATVDDGGRTFDVNDERFLRPLDMDLAVRNASGLGATGSRAQVTRCILESIAGATAAVVTEIGHLVGRPVQDLFVVGGGTRMELMNELYRRHTGLPVTVGSPEATALGNAMVQGVAVGRFSDLRDARRCLTTK